MKTSHGHQMADVYSCLQKYVRRGDFAESVYWGSQIAVAADEFKGYPNALKRRLMQHALEDVGSLDFAVKLLAAKTPTWESLVPWMQVLCGLPKTRAAAWFNRVAVEHVGNPGAAPTAELRRAAEAQILHRDGDKKGLAAVFSKDTMGVYKELNNEVLALHMEILRGSWPAVSVPEPAAAVEIPAAWLITREVPDWAYDKHTAKGAAMGRGYAHFFETMVVAPALFPGEDRFAEEAKALYLNGKEQRVRHILAASDTAKAAEKAAAKEAAKATKAAEKAATKEAAKATKAAEKLKAKEEAKAAKAATLVATKATKAAERKAAKEAAGPSYVAATAPPASYTNVVQIQPITGRAKARAWFATADNKKQVVIKGPVKSAEAEAVMKTETLKRSLGLPHANVRVEGDKDSYIVADNLVGDYTTFPTKVVTTKLEKEVTVIDCEKANMCIWDQAMLAEDGKTQNLLVALAFRKVAGANDTCNRNFVLSGETVYSVDDAAVEKETAHIWSKGLVKPKASYEAALTKHWDAVKATLESWKSKVPADSYAAKRIAELSDQEGWKW